MTNRRQFVHAGIAASLGGALATIFPLRAGADTRRDNAEAALPLYLTVFDDRFADSVRFGRAVAHQGIATHAIHGDVTNLWYRDLHPRWMEGAVPIAGLTTHGPLFCLERLAWDHDMRVVYRGAHRWLPDGTIEHELESSARAPAVVRNRLSGLDSWPAEIASLITSIGSPAVPIPMTGPGVERARGVSRCSKPGGELDRPLYSWAIAPRIRPARS